jgi:hypothetical protein
MAAKISAGVTIYVDCDDVDTANVIIEVDPPDEFDRYDVRLLDEYRNPVDSSYKLLAGMDAVAAVVSMLIKEHLQEAFEPDVTGREE